MGLLNNMLSPPASPPFSFFKINIAGGGIELPAKEHNPGGAGEFPSAGWGFQAVCFNSIQLLLGSSVAE